MKLAKRNFWIAAILLCGCLAGGFLLGKGMRPSLNLDLVSTAEQVRKLYREDDGLAHFLQVSIFKYDASKRVHVKAEVHGFIQESPAKYLKNTHNFTILDFAACLLTEEDMRYLGSLRTLEQLYINNCELDEEHIPHLSGSGLKALEVCCRPAPSPHWVKTIASMKNLEELRLWHISDFSPYAEVLAELPNLRILVLQDVKLTPEDIIATRKIKNLQYLCVDEEYTKNNDLFFKVNMNRQNGTVKILDHGDPTLSINSITVGTISGPLEP